MTVEKSTLPSLLRRSIVGVILTFILAVGTNRSTLAQTVELEPVRDIWTTSVFSYDGENHFSGIGGGLNNDELIVGGWGDEYRSLLLFDLSGVSSPVSSATLRLYHMGSPDGRHTPVSMVLDRVTSDWDWTTEPLDAGTLDNERLWWDDRPSFVPVSSSLPAPAIASFYEIDVTEVVNGQVSGAYNNYGFQLRPESRIAEFNYFASSENGNQEWRPKLVLETNGSTGPCSSPVECAREAVSTPYKWGFDGWDINDGKWVTPLELIQSAYRDDSGIGPGVDCSGLIQWAHGLADSLDRGLRPIARQLCSSQYSDPVTAGNRQTGDLITVARAAQPAHPEKVLSIMLRFLLDNRAQARRPSSNPKYFGRRGLRRFR